MKLLISLSSFGAAEVRRHGQGWCARLSREAGADSVEVRGELLQAAQPDAAPNAALDAELRALHGQAEVYSSPEGLFAADHSLDLQALQRGMHAAELLGAPRLKMSIGAFSAHAGASREGLANLRKRLHEARIELLIENDQTESAGSLSALTAFFSACDAQGLALGMTFDMGNWHWLGECPLEAARHFAARVRYVHCKGVQRLPAKWVAVPLAESAAPWRAVLRALPADVPHAIEYPLVGDDLLRVTREEITRLRAIRKNP